ncbi:hypothetical protein PF005_g6042 [Phytophthora fragariae]|uniref:Uncharacterized protein n=1 Tax=Phytophthora fragariae TaxID=53985 RepID=A0A6A4E9X1_9STRA|nr:hypothetical protein PF009_g6756 [Phytophthora fragariae]KAE9021152.1 hypothetical protein PF011_g5083 [Phytophthora fragariae]KAE9125258.1 hypothetical protein PF010_g5698 [Phytophthora fragariae]KAE9150274.1 hypothetical protein PF006_g5327 [Phytophthora fragariae]KAE9224105.1 hypothetical protein PF005_g6042 [Phytophthora fragariae]
MTAVVKLSALSRLVALLGAICCSILEFSSFRHEHPPSRRDLPPPPSTKPRARSGASSSRALISPTLRIVPDTMRCICYSGSMSLVIRGRG